MLFVAVKLKETNSSRPKIIEIQIHKIGKRVIGVVGRRYTEMTGEIKEMLTRKNRKFCGGKKHHNAYQGSSGAFHEIEKGDDNINVFFDGQ